MHKNQRLIFSLALLLCCSSAGAQTWEGLGDPVFCHSPRALSLAGAHSLPLAPPSVISANPALLSFGHASALEYIYAYNQVQGKDLPPSGGWHESERHELATFFGTIRGGDGKVSGLPNALSLGFGRYPLYDYRFKLKHGGNEWNHDGGIYSYACAASLMVKQFVMGLSLYCHRGRMEDDDLSEIAGAGGALAKHLSVEATGFGGALGLALRREVRREMMGWLGLSVSSPDVLRLKRSQVVSAGMEEKEEGKALLPPRFRSSLSVRYKYKYLLAASYLYVPFSLVMSDDEDILRLEEQGLNDVRAYGVGFEIAEKRQRYRLGVSRRRDFRRWQDKRGGQCPLDYYVYSVGWGLSTISPAGRGKRRRAGTKLDLAFTYSERGQEERHYETKREYRGLASLVVVP